MANVKMSDLHPDYDSWFDCWYSDKKDILSCMYHNLAADLDAGYNPLGDCIKRQRADIAAYEQSINDALMSFVNMDDKKRDRWCFYDMLRRGAIA